jgi:mono/diheme cytochrome c family protein
VDFRIDARIKAVRVTFLKIFGLGVAFACACATAQTPAEKSFSPGLIKAGADIFSTRCAVCHGENMKNPPWAIDLHTFPRDERRRFVDSVTYGVRNMPPWGDVLKPEEIDALWAYVAAGDGNN